MRFRTIFGIHREGWVVLLPIAFCGWVLAELTTPMVLLPLALLLMAGAVLFHEPDHQLSSSPLGVVSPIDGTVLAIDNLRDPYLDRDAIRVRVGVRLFGGYYLRAAIEGKLQGLKRRDGIDRDQASWIQSDEHDDVVVAVAAGSMFGLKPCAACLGERVGQGRKCGLRRATRLLDVYLPASSYVKTTVGERVEAGVSVLAQLVHAVGQVNSGHAIGSKMSHVPEAEATSQ